MKNKINEFIDILKEVLPNEMEDLFNIKIPDIDTLCDNLKIDILDNIEE